MLRFDKIVCPVDFDQNSVVALRIALELAQERGATLHLLHVVPMPPGPEVALPFGKLETEARTKLEKLARREIGAKVSYKVEVMMGDPRVEVVALAKRLRADLIVMATHGRRGVRHLVLGSVAEGVVREAPCLVTHGQAETARNRISAAPVRRKAPRLREPFRVFPRLANRARALRLSIGLDIRKFRVVNDAKRERENSGRHFRGIS